MEHRNPLKAGLMIAALSAVAFGVSAPAVARGGLGVGPFATASLLYAGALASSWIMSGFDVRTPFGILRRHGGRIVIVAALGAALAPAAFAWGLQRSGATTGSLLLNFEAVFTALLAWLIFREPFGRRFTGALALMASGGAVLALDGAKQAHFHVVGLVAVIAATLCWALDNTLTRGLSDEPPFAVVAAKSGLGAAFAFGVSRYLSEPTPTSFARAAVLLVTGAVGYGLSLRLYLEAQSRIGAARTASIFALAPFVGALVAWLIGDRAIGPFSFLSVPLFGAAVYLHFTERHQHAHRHVAEEHEHPHRHDDGHHLHAHDPPFTGEHTHRHRHEPVEHAHDHAPDVHHQHSH